MTINPAALPSLENELRALQAQKKRHETDTLAIVGRLAAFKERKGTIAAEKARVRTELDQHGRVITTGLGGAINTYLKRLNAGFRIDYREPDYRGKEPSASYNADVDMASPMLGCTQPSTSAS